MYNISDTDRDFEALLTPSKLREIDAQFDNNFFTQEATFELLSLGVQTASKLKFESSRIVWNAACFVNILSYDLKIIVRAMMNSKREWEKRMYARQGALLIYEAINDIFELLGKSFRDIIATLPDKESIEASLIEIRTSLNSFKDMNFDKIKEIRHVAAAHRDQDTLKLLQTIYSISWTDSFNICSAFDKIVNKLGAVLQTLTARVKELEGLD
jgi:hypothetical protein